MVAVLLASASYAADGVLEINQTCAVKTGCFAGDSPGFPVMIYASGSYRLTSNLDTSPDTSADGIVVSVDGVTIDLNGFEIAGPVTCTGQGSAIVCDPATGRGIDGGLRARLALRDGRIRGFGSGIVAGRRAQIWNLVAESNQIEGIVTGERSLVSHSSAHGNGNNGVTAGDGSVVERCIANGNGSTGIFAGTGSSVIGNVASANGAVGFSVGSSCVVRENTSGSNEDHGIIVGFGSVVSDNTARDNGGHGIFCLMDSALQRNSALGNTGFGLNLAASTTYRANVVNDNAAGTVSGGINLGDNSCTGTTICP